VEECLARYPEYAKQLRPLLRTVYFLNIGPNSTPFPAHQTPGRKEIAGYLKKRPAPQFYLPAFRRLTLAVAMVIALLVTTTAQAQSALPGENLYDWKRASENVWRAVSPDVVATDIAIANRRIEEQRAVADDPQLSATVMTDYLEVLRRLEAVQDARSLALIVPAVQAHQQTLIEVSAVVAVSSAPLNKYLIEETDDFSTQAAAVVASADVPINQPAPTATRVPPTATRVPPTATRVPPTATNVPPTATEVPPTATEVPPTATATEVPPTATATEVPPTSTPIETEVPPTPTLAPPSPTPVPPTPVPPTPTPVPPTPVPPTPVPPTPMPPTPTEEAPVLPQSGSE
jgi:hypothetical protein